MLMTNLSTFRLGIEYCQSMNLWHESRQSTIFASFSLPERKWNVCHVRHAVFLQSTVCTSVEGIL